MDKEVVVHIYKGILLSHKKNDAIGSIKIMPLAATWTDLEIIIPSKVYIIFYMLVLAILGSLYLHINF